MSRRYVAGRIARSVPMLLGVVTLGFVLVQLAPGDPILALAGENGDAAYYERMRIRFGLDRPVPEQFLRYVGRVLQGDLGTSAVQGRPVTSVIGSRLPNTLLLAGSALLLSTVVGVAIGVVAASRPGGVRDRSLTTIALVLYAVPVFWLGQVALIWLALRWGWFPVQGRTDARSQATGFAHVLDVAHHLALPAMVLASQQLAAIARLTRTSTIAELDMPYIDAARARGLPGRRVLVGHALRGAMLPVVTVIGNRVGHLVSGAVVTEIVFGWPGIGRLLVTSTTDRDLPVLLGLFLLVGTAVLAANLLTDLAYARLDPRIALR